MNMEITESGSDQADICTDHVRRNDPDRYLCAMFTPAHARSALMSIYAFNIELAMVRERVNEQLLGEMRFQWWRDQIGSSYAGSVRPEGTAGAVYDFIRQYDPPREYFDTLIDSRTRDLSDDLFEDLIAFEKYCCDSTAPLIQLSFVPLAFQADVPIALQAGHEAIPDSIARSVGTAWAIAGLIRAIPVHAAHGRCMIPLSLMNRHGLTRETVFLDQARPHLKLIVEELTTLAENHLNSARAQAQTVNAALFSGFLPLVMANFYLSTIRKSGFDPFHTRVQQPNRAARALRLLYASWRKRC